MGALPDAVDRYLRIERLCRIATSGPDGLHQTPVWYLWQDGRIWLHLVTASRRWRNLQHDPAISVLMDTGSSIDDYRGVEFVGTAELGVDPPAEIVEAHHRKYRGSSTPIIHTVDGHAWVAVTPQRERTWGWGAPAKIDLPAALDPADISRLLIPLMNSGDLEAICALYEPDAVLVRRDGTVARGIEEIRQAYEWTTLERAGLIPGTARTTLVSGDLALTATEKHGGGTTVEIARRQSDGTWLWAVDNPWFS